MTLKNLSLDKIAARLIGMCAIALFASSCAVSQGPASALTEDSISGFVPRSVSPGDVIEVSFFRTNEYGDEPYRIQPGDVLRVSVFGHESLSEDNVLVLPDGRISLAGAGEAIAEGLSPAELTKVLVSKYKALQIRNPRVSVALRNADVRVKSLTQPSSDGPRRFTIVVDDHGAIDLPYIEPVEARGTLKSIQEKIDSAYKVAFQGQVDVTVNFRERIEPRVFVLGEVEQPGGVGYAPPMTALMAVSSAGGFMDTANTAEVQLFRLQPDGRFESQKLKLRRGKGGLVRLNEEVALRTGDIIYVPKTGVAVANSNIEQYIRRMIPTAVGFGLSYDVR